MDRRRPPVWSAGLVAGVLIAGGGRREAPADAKPADVAPVDVAAPSGAPADAAPVEVDVPRVVVSPLDPLAVLCIL